ncbi:MAG: GFA family protein [Alphaproteobacteria bacterium]
MSDKTKTGGCLCGAVRYELTQDLLGMGQCHCRDCQIVAGGSPAHVVLVPTGSIKVTGELKEFRTTAANGNTPARKFCPECGTHLFSAPGGESPLEVVKVGTLDDPSNYVSTAVLWTSSAQPWHSIPKGAATFEKDIG